MKYYAGIGARATPKDICEIMTQCAAKLEKQGFWLRSGGAEGADIAFQRGVKEKAEIHLPWKNFNLSYQQEHPNHIYKVIRENDIAARESLKFHPDCGKLKRAVELLMMRNFYQIQGEPNSSFIICWTASGEAERGTGQALRIAAHYEIPIFNLAREKDLKRIVDFIS